MPRHGDVDAIEEPEVKSARTSEVSDRERREEVVADGEISETEIPPAATVVGEVKDGFVEHVLAVDWASLVCEWQGWGRILLRCKSSVLNQYGKSNRKHLNDFQNLLLMFSKLRIAAESGCDNCRLTHQNELYVDDLSLHGRTFVQIVKGEFSCDDEQYQSSLEWFLCSIERLLKYLREGPVPSRPRSAPGGLRGNRAYRCKAWNEFLQNLNVNNKKSIPFSSVKELPKRIQSLIRDGEQVPVKDYAEPILEYLLMNFGYTRKVVKQLTNEASRIHFIAPILFCVGSLFDDIEIAFEETIEGVTVKAHGRFEFLIKRNGKAVGIVEAKKDKIDEGVAQALLGCQVLMDKGSHAAYAIVTDFERWIFIRDREETILKESVYMPFLSEGFDTIRLRQVVGKIYSILSDE